MAARRRAIEAYRRWLSADPSAGAAVGPLIRYLIEDGRPREAVSVARTHVWAAPGVESRLWLGLALHASGEFVAAEAAFDGARAAAVPAERGALDDVSVLLGDEEAEWYGALDPRAREAYNRRFWAFSDPSFLQPGNERRAEHYARQAWTRILDDAPRTTGTVSWGDDRAEILLRYGVPFRLERVPEPAFRLHFETRVVTYHDPRAVPLTPEALHTTGIDGLPPPGAPSPLERDTVRSTYAPAGTRRVRGLTGQVTRIPSAEGWRLRVDAQLPPDTASSGPSPAPRVRLTVLDTLGVPLAHAAGVWEPGPGGSRVVRAESDLPPGSYVYQIEAVDDSLGLLGLGRFRIGRPAGSLRLSDPLLAAPDSVGPGGRVVGSRRELAPFPSAVVASGELIRVFAEAAGLLRAGGMARYTVEWALEPAEPPSALARVFGWLGRVIGREAAEEPAVLWDAVWKRRDPVLITFQLALTGLERGSYRLRVTVRDRISGREATSCRAVRVEAPSAAGRRGGSRN